MEVQVLLHQVVQLAEGPVLLAAGLEVFVAGKGCVGYGDRALVQAHPEDGHQGIFPDLRPVQLPAKQGVLSQVNCWSAGFRNKDFTC